MSRSFSPYDKITTVKKSNNMEEMEDLLKKHKGKIAPYINEVFCDANLTSSRELSLKTLKLTVYDGSSLEKDAISAASNCDPDMKAFIGFVDRLTQILVHKLPTILGCAAAFLECSYDVDFRPHEHFLLSLLKQPPSGEAVGVDNLPFLSESSTTKPGRPRVHHVQEDDRDICYHILQIICFLCSTKRRLKSSGLVVFCCSQELVAPLFILAHFINEASPPAGLFSFIPVVSVHAPKVSFGNSISVIFHSSDLDAAARNSIISVRDRCGTSRWRSSFILIEEAAEQDFLRKLENIYKKDQGDLSNSQWAFQIPSYFVEAAEKHTAEAETLFGAKLIRPISENSGPLLAVNVETSAFKATGMLPGPVIYVIKFRTAKEAVALANYLVNCRQYTKGSLIDMRSTFMVASLWLSSLSLTWQIAFQLTSSGITDVFVNCPYDRLSTAMYRSCSKDVELSALHLTPQDNSKEVNSAAITGLTNVLMNARKAQESWFNQGYHEIHRKMIELSSELSSFGLDIRSICNDLIRAIALKLTDFENIGLGSKQALSSGTVALARQWIVPRGPFVIILSETSLKKPDYIDRVRKLITLAVCTGNAAVILSPSHLPEKEKLLDCVNRFKTIPVFSNLVYLYLWEAQSTENCFSSLYSVAHIGSVCCTEVVEDSDDCNRSNFVEDALPLLIQTVKIFTSAGGEIYAN
ncbi:unnamed protein product [Calicophoron daubneyi]|uniref:Aldehyde dehydrogenase domain-containing protein n=1 Tax=Calicophoron daubneyi TaxID=300641 RepID=A0AAV2TSX4_CALDB